MGEGLTVTPQPGVWTRVISQGLEGNGGDGDGQLLLFTSFPSEGASLCPGKLQCLTQVNLADTPQALQGVMGSSVPQNIQVEVLAPSSSECDLL